MKYALISVSKQNNEDTKNVLIKCTELPNKEEAKTFFKTYGTDEYWKDDDLIISTIEEVNIDYNDASYNLSSIHSWPVFEKSSKGLTVLDLALLLGDNIRISLLDENGSEMAKYDGKDSIPEEFNNRIVKSIRPNWILWKLEIVI